MSQGKSGAGSWLTTSLLFFLGWVFMYADRTILSPVQGVIREEFLLSNAEVGLITSVFFIMYTAVQIPSGLLGDRFGRTRSFSLASWCLEPRPRSRTSPRRSSC